jgi:hypothetical protein
MMSRKDYITVADILAENRNSMDRETFQNLIEDFSDFFLKDNPNFSPNRFELACYAETANV